MRAVIAHDWLTNIAGSESVLKAFSELYPDAEIVCSVADPDLAARYLPGRRVRSLLDPRLPGILESWWRYAPLMLARWAQVRLDCDLLLVSSHFGAHGATVRAGAPSLVYYHSPMRVAWRLDIEAGRLPARARPLAAGLVPVLARYDRWVAGHTGVMVANSRATAARIEAVYGRAAAVVHPPVAAAPEPPAATGGRPEVAGPYYLYFGRLVAYKRPDLAVAACRELGRPLVVAGYGPMLDELRRGAGPSTVFVERPGDEEKWRLLAGARALVFPGEEDFGIVPVEALSVGTPVIGFGVGGLADSIDSDDLGERFMRRDVATVKEAVLRFERRSFDPAVLKAAAARFSADAFKVQILELLDAHRLPLPRGSAA